MNKRILTMSALAGILILFPLEALAALCWTDNFGATYSIEVGPGSGSTMLLHGFRKPGVGSCSVAPVTGSAFILNPTTALVGWRTQSIDPPNGCVGFHETLTVQLATLLMTGNFRNDVGIEGINKLTPSAC